MLSLPSQIKVGPFTFDVKKAEKLIDDDGKTGLWGLYLPECHSIILSEEMDTPAKLAEIVIHEVGHAIWDMMRLGKRPKEEKVVTYMARGWLQVYQENPGLLKWLNEATR